MKQKTVILFATIICLLQVSLPMWADRYQVLFANSEKIIIGKQVAKKGLIFSDEDHIIWTSETQALKVLNLSTNTVMVIAKKGFDRQKAQSLADYLHKVKHLSTRDYNTATVLTDTICYLLDTLRIDAGNHYGGEVIDEVVFKVDGELVTSKIQKTKDGTEFILTRQIYVTKKAKPVYLDIIETDKQRDWRYYVYRKLYIEPLPINADF